MSILLQRALLAVESRPKHDAARMEICARANEHRDPNVRFLGARLDAEHAVHRMFQLLDDQRTPVGIQICALAFIADHAFRDEAVGVAILMLRAESSGIRREAIRVLGKLRAREAVFDLCALCRHVEGESALTMARSLEQIGGEETEPGLLELLDLSDLAVRLRTLEALERCGTLAALEALHTVSATPTRSTALARAIRNTRARIIERSLDQHVEKGRLSVATTEAKGQLSEVHELGALSAHEAR